jgi:hypothetical protein
MRITIQTDDCECTISEPGDDRTITEAFAMFERALMGISFSREMIAGYYQSVAEEIAADPSVIGHAD